MSEYTGKRIVPKHCGVWSSVNEYEMLSIVLYGATGDSYMARKAVPKGVDITDTEYWAFCADYSAQLSMIASDVDALETDLKSLKEQVAANVTASTDSDADYAAEVADARVDPEGETYDSLGEVLRSVTSGLQPKRIPAETGAAALSSYGNSASIEVASRTVKAGFSFTGNSYIGLFAGFFGTYADEADKTIRIVMWCDQETSFEALLTNGKTAWGSSDGSIVSLIIGSVTFTEGNHYRAALDIDFTKQRYADFADGLAEGSETLYFCLRKADSACTGTVYFYAYEVNERRDLLWKYVTLHDDLMFLTEEIESARNDGTEYSKLQDVFLAHREDLDRVLQEIDDSHTDSYGIESGSLAERLASVDVVLRPKCPISAIARPRDNTNLWLDSIEGAQMGAEIIRNNARYWFDHEVYIASATPDWGSIHFSFSVKNAYLASLGDLSRLYLSLKIEGMDSTRLLHDGENMKVIYYVNGYSNWGTTVNPKTTTYVTIGSETRIELPENYLQKILDAGLPLSIVFDGSFLNCEAVSDMGQVQITASIVDKGEKEVLSAYNGYVEYAESAGSAEKAAEAETAGESNRAAWAEEASYAEASGLADNFFTSSVESLLNEDGVRYSPCMDTAEIPEAYPYTYKHGFQDCVSPTTVTKEENGFSPMMHFSITLSASSSQNGNQGYMKLLNGMLSWDDIYEKLTGGYSTGYICEIEDCMNYPEGAEAGYYSNELLLAYFDESGGIKIAAHVSEFQYRKISDSLTLRVWKFTVSDTHLDLIAEMKTAGTFKSCWFGIWHTVKYVEEETAIWEPKWYWQDYAFTDGSFSDEEMLTYFQKKYTYWASYVNHMVLKEKFAAIDEEFEELAESVDAAKTEAGTANGAVSSIVCWGDSLTAGGGWTSTLQTLSGLTVYNGGTGGESARTIMARQGADVMLVNHITIPAACEAVTIATMMDDGGISTQFGRKATPLLQGGAHVNPVMIEDVEGTLAWTGSSYADTTGTWTFTRSEAGEAVEITRPTAIRTNFDRIHNGKDTIMIIFMGQNGGYSSIDDLINMHRLMIDHFKGKEYLILGLSSGTASSRASYEAAMQEAFGRRFLSLREYLSTALYDEDGNIISCYGLDDQGLEMEEEYTYGSTTYVTADEIAAGTVPHQILSDSVHYTSGTKTVIGNLIYKRLVELGILEQG